VQFALSTHSFFECLSIGIESSDAIAYTLTFAIVFHKWAEALTLGFSYYASGMSKA
jgi:zinc transporter ZupT